jgi:hypothetical protein
MTTSHEETPRTTTTVDELRSSFRELDPSAHELDFLRPYFTDNDCLFVSSVTGIVSTPRRMTASAVLEHWSRKIFSNPSSNDYSASFPYAAARQLYVWRTLQDYLASVNATTMATSIVDFASGECAFPLLVQKEQPGWTVSATEAAEHLVDSAREAGLTVYKGGLGLGELPPFKADIGTLMWTLSCSLDPMSVLSDIWDHLHDSGLLVVAESSRIMVPFKKSLHDLIGKENPADTHPFYFSARSLRAVLAITGFDVIFENRFHDSDVLVMIARKTSVPAGSDRIAVDSPAEVIEFFRKWHEVTIFFEKLDSGDRLS